MIKPALRRVLLSERCDCYFNRVNATMATINATRHTSHDSQIGTSHVPYVISNP